MMSREIFKEKELQEKFDKQGYVVIREAITKFEVSALREYYDNNYEERFPYQTLQ